MKSIGISYRVTILLLLTLFIITPLLAEETTPINVTSQNMFVDRDKGLVVFKGDVVVIKGDMTINADELKVFYGENKEIKRLQAIGRVKILREGSVATGEKADFYNKEEKLVLTGNPKFTEGQNSVEGERMTIFIKEGRSIVEGGSKKKIKAVFMPQEEKKGDGKR